MTLKFEAVEGGIKLTSHTVDAAGQSIEGGYVSKFDGTDVPWQGNPEADTASAKRVNDNNYQNLWKKDGKVTINSKVIVSADGKTLTVVQTGRNAKGMPIENIEMFSRE
jgi:hypothetical protein